MTNTTLLQMAIVKSKKTKRELAKALGLSEMGLYKKITGKTEFKGKEISQLKSLLSLTSDETTTIFLNSK